MLEVFGVYVFGELLDMFNVRELVESDFVFIFWLFIVFVYGIYVDYLVEVWNFFLLIEV